MKNKNVSILRKIIWTIMIAAFLNLLPAISALAEETEGSELFSGTLMVTTESVTIRTEAKNNADELAIIPEGSFILVTGQTDDGWFVVGYQGQIGYFKGKGKDPVKQESAVNVDDINQEMEQQAVQSLFLGEEMIQYQESKHKALFWAIAIGIAIVGVFVAAIISGKRKEEKKTEDKKTPEVVATDSDDIFVGNENENDGNIDDEFANMTIEFDLEDQEAGGFEKKHNEENDHHDIDAEKLDFHVVRAEEKLDNIDEEENEMYENTRELKFIDLDNLCEDSL